MTTLLKRSTGFEVGSECLIRRYLAWPPFPEGHCASSSIPRTPVSYFPNNSALSGAFFQPNFSANSFGV